VPFVLEVRDLWPEAIIGLGLMRPNGLGVRALSALARFLYAQAAHIVVVTGAFSERLQKLGVAARVISVIPNGADTRFFAADASARAAARMSLGLGDEFLIAYVGSHGLSHGLGAVLDAAERQPDVTYLLVGDGADRDRLVAERDRRGLRNVIMHRSVPRSDVPGLYAAADVCLVPLRDVPLFTAFVPSKLFEVLAAGRPIIGAVRGEARSILERSGGAVLVDPERGDQIAAAVECLRSEPELRARLGEQGRAFAVASYDRDALAARYLDVLQRVVANG
jgi:glycosyltransferase involved in cell wall biosynthesis